MYMSITIQLYVWPRKHAVERKKGMSSKSSKKGAIKGLKKTIRLIRSKELLN